MAERISNSNPSDLLHKIKGFVRSLLQDLSSNRSPSIALDRYRNYCSDPSGNCSCSYDLPNGKEIISIEKEAHARRLDVLLRVLLIIQQLLQENKHRSKRDIYYTHPALFVEQAVVDHAINDICVLLKCSRHHLNVVPVGKGLVMGWLRFVEAGRKICCIRSPDKAYPIPVCIEEVEALSIAMSTQGRGYPDVPTRRFLHHLVEQLHLPVYCLVDSDPYGFDILMTYKFGSMQMAYDAKLMRVPEIQWLGIFPSDFEAYHLPERCLLHLTPEDKRKVEAMLSRCYLHKEAPKWRLELEMMLHKGVKFEIEALSIYSISFLSKEYIPVKIQHGKHM